MVTKTALLEFEKKVADEFEAGHIKGPIHLSRGNENELIEIFQDIGPEDWVFCTYRSHYHALLYGVPEDWLFKEILAGRSMNIFYKRFFTSAIVGGCLPIALGVAAAIKRNGGSEKVWCFVGDMAACGGAFSEAARYAGGHGLPVSFMVEDNGVACLSPTREVWGVEGSPVYGSYSYKNDFPHCGIGKWVTI